MEDTFGTIKEEISDLYRNEQSRRNAVLCIAQLPADNFNLGLDEDGEII